MSDPISSLSATIEALLFSEGGPVSKKRIAQLARCTAADLDAALFALRERLSGGLTLIETDTEAALAVSAEAAGAVAQAQEGELSREIGDAGLEVLAIVLYRGPSSRAQIDYIRGVNTSSTIRTLLSRGLLERAGNPEDAREYLYRPTTELLAHLGAASARDLPDYATISGELAAFDHREGKVGDLKGEPFASHDGNAADTAADA